MASFLCQKPLRRSTGPAASPKPSLGVAITSPLVIPLRRAMGPGHRPRVTQQKKGNRPPPESPRPRPLRVPLSCPRPSSRSTTVFPILHCWIWFTRTTTTTCLTWGLRRPAVPPSQVHSCPHPRRSHRPPLTSLTSHTSHTTRQDFISPWWTTWMCRTTASQAQSTIRTLRPPVLRHPLVAHAPLPRHSLTPPPPRIRPITSNDSNPSPSHTYTDQQYVPEDRDYAMDYEAVMTTITDFNSMSNFIFRGGGRDGLGDRGCTYSTPERMLFLF